MSDSKHLTVRALRELAREHLGRGYSRLKTKAELVSALKKAVPQVIDAWLGRSRDAEGAEGAEGAEAAAEKPASMLPVREEGPVSEEGGSTRVAEFSIAEPLVEGFFVARVAGEHEVQRKHLVESDVPFREAIAATAREAEALGELPAAYQDEDVVLLPRDPTTLYFFWDLQPTLARGATVGLPSARALVKVFDEDRLIREQEFPLEAKSFYLHDLTPGHTYRVECYLRGSDGRTGPMRAVSHAVQLPSEGPSPDLEVRVMRVQWNAPLAPAQTAAWAARGHLATIREGFVPSSESIRGPRAERPETGHLNLPSGPGARGAAGGLEASRAAPRVESSPPDWSRGPHLDLPSSQAWRGAPGGLESSGGLKSGRQ